MSDIHVGDDVTFHGHVFNVRGLSPMSATPRRVLLENRETGETRRSTSSRQSCGTSQPVRSVSVAFTSAAVKGHRKSARS